MVRSRISDSFDVEMQEKKFELLNSQNKALMTKLKEYRGKLKEETFKVKELEEEINCQLSQSQVIKT